MFMMKKNVDIFHDGYVLSANSTAIHMTPRHQGRWGEVKSTIFGEIWGVRVQSNEHESLQFCFELFDLLSRASFVKRIALSYSLLDFKIRFVSVTFFMIRFVRSDFTESNPRQFGICELFCRHSSVPDGYEYHVTLRSSEKDLDTSYTFPSGSKWIFQVLFHRARFEPSYTKTLTQSVGVSSYSLNDVVPAKNLVMHTLQLSTSNLHIKYKL